MFFQGPKADPAYHAKRAQPDAAKIAPRTFDVLRAEEDKLFRQAQQGIAADAAMARRNIAEGMLQAGRGTPVGTGARNAAIRSGVQQLTSQLPQTGREQAALAMEMADRRRALPTPTDLAMEAQAAIDQLIMNMNEAGWNKDAISRALMARAETLKAGGDDATAQYIYMRLGL